MTNDQSIGQSHNNTYAKSKTTVNDSRADIHSFKQLSTMTGTEEVSSSHERELQNISEQRAGNIAQALSLRLRQDRCRCLG